MNSAKTSKMGLWMSVVAMAMGASAAMATDETQTSQALIGDFTPDRPDVGTIGFPSPPPGGGAFTPPVAVNPETPGIYEPPVGRPERPPLMPTEIMLIEAKGMLSAVWYAHNDEMYATLTSVEVNNPVSRQSISAALAQIKSQGKAAQAEMKSFQVQAAAQMRAAGASKDQLKELSECTKYYQLETKIWVKYFLHEIRGLGIWL